MAAAAQFGNNDVRERGSVKWFNGAKGFGFIRRSTGEDVFVHFTEIQMAGYRTLDEGAEVEYDLRQLKTSKAPGPKLDDAVPEVPDLLDSNHFASEQSP